MKLELLSSARRPIEAVATIPMPERRYWHSVIRNRRGRTWTVRDWGDVAIVRDVFTGRILRRSKLRDEIVAVSRAAHLVEVAS